MMILAAIALAGVQTVPPGTYQMNSADVQACGAMAVERNSRVAELARRDAALQVKTDDLKAKQDAVEAQRSSVDLKKKKDVERFNALVADANAARTAVQPEMEARNAYVTENNTFSETFNAKCAHRSFAPADLAALPEDQRTALSATATTRTIMVPGKTTTTIVKRRR